MDEIRSWWEVPSVAHFCSLFRTAFDLTDFDIEELEDGLLASSSELGSPFLDDLFASILRGCYGRQDIERYNYEVYLKDIIKHRWQVEAGRESPLENEEFCKLSLRLKVEILHALCDYRLDADDVSEALKGHDGDNMRVQPMGTDGEDAKYWYFYGIRLYKEDPEPPLAAKDSKKDLQKKKKKKKKDKKKNKQKKNKKSSKADSKKQQSESVPDCQVATTSTEPQSSAAADRWHLICTFEDDWAKLAETFKKTKIPCERRLFKAITEDFIPILPTIIEEREKQRRKRLLETAPRRVSDRLGKKKANFSEQDRATAAIKAEEDREKMEEEEERRRQLELERIVEQNRLREERMKAKEERARRVWQREERAQLIADGKEIPPELLYAPDSPVAIKKIKIELEDHVLTGMFKVLEAVKSHRESWPFLEPVLEEHAPHYNEIIKRPMDLSQIEKKLNDKVYTSIKQFLNDFQLMYNNCSQYNGPSNEYTLMAGKLIQCMQKAVRRYMTIDQYESDEDYFINAEPSILKMYRPSREASSRAKEVFVRYAEDELSNSSGPSSPSSVSDIVEGSWNSTDDILSSLTGTPVSGLSKQPNRNSNVLMGMLNTKHTDVTATLKPGINFVLNGAQVRPQTKIISVTLGRNPQTGAQQPLYEQIIQQREQKLQRKMSTNQNEPLSPSQHAPVLYPLVKAAIAKGNINPGIILTAQQAGTSPMNQQQHQTIVAGKFPPYQLKTGAVKILSTPDGMAKKATPLPALTQYVKSQQSTIVTSDADLVMPKEYKILGSIAKGSQIVQGTKINVLTTGQQQIISGIIQPSSSVVQTNLTKENILKLSKSAQLAQSAIHGKPTVVYYSKSNVPGNTDIATASGLMQQSVSGNFPNATTQLLKFQSLPKSLGNNVQVSSSNPVNLPGAGNGETKNESLIENTMKPNTIQNSAGNNVPYFIQASPGHIQNVSRIQVVQNVSRIRQNMSGHPISLHNSQSGTQAGTSIIPSNSQSGAPVAQTLTITSSVATREGSTVPTIMQSAPVVTNPVQATMTTVPVNPTGTRTLQLATGQKIVLTDEILNVLLAAKASNSPHKIQLVVNPSGQVTATTLVCTTSTSSATNVNVGSVSVPHATTSVTQSIQQSINVVPQNIVTSKPSAPPVIKTYNFDQPPKKRKLFTSDSDSPTNKKSLSGICSSKNDNNATQIVNTNYVASVLNAQGVSANVAGQPALRSVQGASHNITTILGSPNSAVTVVRSPVNSTTSNMSIPTIHLNSGLIASSGVSVNGNTQILKQSQGISVLVNTVGQTPVVHQITPNNQNISVAGLTLQTLVNRQNSAIGNVLRPTQMGVASAGLSNVVASGLNQSVAQTISEQNQLKPVQVMQQVANSSGLNQSVPVPNSVTVSHSVAPTISVQNQLQPVQVVHQVANSSGLNQSVPIPNSVTVSHSVAPTISVQNQLQPVQVVHQVANSSGLNQSVSVPNSVTVSHSVAPTISVQNQLQPVQVVHQVANSSGLNQSVPVPNSVTVSHSVAPTISVQNQLQPVQVVQQVVNSSPQNMKVISIGPGHPYYQQILLQQQQRQIQAQQQVIQMQAVTPAVSQESKQPGNNT